MLTRVGTVLQESTYDVGRRLSWRGWALTCRMSGESRISTATTSERAGAGEPKQPSRPRPPPHTDKAQWAQLLALWGRRVPGPSSHKAIPGDLVIPCLRSSSVIPSGLFSDCAPVTLRSCWFLCGSQIKSWRMWLPSAPGSGSPWLCIGEAMRDRKQGGHVFMQ